MEKEWKGKKKYTKVPRKQTMPVASRKASEQFPPLQGLPSSGLLHEHTLPSHGHEPKRDDRESVCEKIVLENQTKLLANNITNIQLYIQYIYKYAWQIIAVIRQPKSAMSDRILIYCNIYIYIYLQRLILTCDAEQVLAWHVLLSPWQYIRDHTCTMFQNPARAETIWTSLKRWTNRLRLFSDCLNDPITTA